MTAEFETSEEAEVVDEATQAFEDLRTEIGELRQAIEALGPTIATGRAPDYSPTLGAIAKTLHAATLRIDMIAKHTGANLAPEIARRMMVNRTPTQRDRTSSRHPVLHECVNGRRLRGLLNTALVEQGTKETGSPEESEIARGQR